MNQQLDLFTRFGVALLIGFLIGLQREYAYGEKHRRLTAGERTFSLLSLSGCLGALLADEMGAPVILAVTFILAAIFAAIGFAANAFMRERVGITTEVAIMLAVLIGALCYYNHLALAAAIGIAITVILNLKVQTDRFVSALTQADITAALQMAVISAIVLPILPNQSFLPPPFDVLNPFKIWLMVVFISGISFLGYVLLKLMTSRQGIPITGLLGGLASSTAVTFSFAKRSQEEAPFARAYAMAIMLAWTMMFGRILVIVGVWNAQLIPSLILAMLGAAGTALIYGLYILRNENPKEESSSPFNNPFNLGQALRFGLLYAVILVGARAAQIYLGNAGIYLSAFVSGLATVDAITITLAELSGTGRLSLDVASQGIILATMSNTFAKGLIVMFSGSRELRRMIIPGMLFVMVAGIAITFLG
jgi:uncharacterized membrane protein (DUF4010 family)